MRRANQVTLPFPRRRRPEPIVEPDEPRSLRIMSGVLRDLSGDRARGLCGVHYAAWQGRRAGWVFNCACGFYPPASKTWSDGLEMLERHWSRRLGSIAERRTA